VINTVVNLSRAFCDPVRDHIRSCQRHLVITKITSPEVLFKIPKEFLKIAEYFSSTTLESGNISRCMGHHHSNIYFQRTNMTGL
jgi:hypothetical protein